MTWEADVGQAKKTTGARKATGGRTRPHGAQPAQANSEGDAFLLNENGTVRVRWRDHNILLWTPTVGEYEKLVSDYEDTRAWYSVDGRTAAEAFSSKAPNAAIWVEVLATLGDSHDDITAADLAPWMLSADSLERLIRHWRVNPLARGETQDLISQVAAQVVAGLQEGATTPSSLPEAPSEASEES